MFIKRMLIIGIVVVFAMMIFTINKNTDKQLERYKEEALAEAQYEPEEPKETEKLVEDKPDSRVLPPTKQQILAYLRQKCFEELVDYEKALAILITENEDLNPGAVHYNDDGTSDYGLFQINTRKLEDYKDKLHITNIFNYKQNIDVGIKIISKLQKYPEHEKYIAYNLGEGGMKELASRGIHSTKYSRKVAAAVNRIESGAGPNE
jgi:ABC-type molybdate transport system substrate-binding protein